MMFLYRGLLLTALSISGCLFSLSLNAQVLVSASIRPLQLIAAAITDGVTEPVLILGATQSPHHAALKPSQRRALAEAELLLWIGPGMEKSLSKVIAGLDAKVITALEIESLQKEQLREGWDPHLWLNTNNARAIAEILTRELSRLDASNSDKYQHNFNIFAAELEELEEQIRSKLAQQKNHAYGVYHNSFQYYEQQFGLSHVVSFTDDEELQPGIKQLRQIRKTLEEKQITCLLVEPSVNTDKLSNIIDNKKMRYVNIDVLGANISLEKNAYSQFMLRLTDAVLECLR